MTATATIDDQLVSQPDQGTIFLSRRSDLRLVRTPRYPIMGPSGQKVGEKPGEAVAFREGRFYCPAEGKVTLEDGREVDADDLRPWMLGHRLVGDVNEGFWAVETVAPPVSSDELQRLSKAAVQHDVETIEAMIAQEVAGWDRADFIGGMRRTIEEVEEVQARVRAEIAAEQALEAQAAEKQAAKTRTQKA